MANEFGSNIPVFSPEPATSGEFGAGIPTYAPQQAVPSKPPVSRTDDIVRSGIAGLAEGVPELVGLPGTLVRAGSAAGASAAQPIEREGGYYLPSMAPGASGRLREITPEQAQEMRSAGPNIVTRALSVLPTGQTVKEAAAKYIPGYRGAMEYQPQTIYGTATKGAMKELPMAAVPLGGPLAGRVGGSLLSGAAAESVRETPEGSGAYSVPLQMGAALAGGVLGTYGTQAAGQFLSAPFRRGETVARDVLENQFRRDLAEASPADRAARMAILKEAADTGVSPEGIAPISLLGESGRKLVSGAGASADDILALNQTVAKAQQAAPDNVARDIAALVGRPSPVSYTQEQALLANYKNSINNPAYASVMALPQAQAIPNSVYAGVTNYSLFQRELPSIMAKAQPLQARLNLVPPNLATGAPGNLAFWDFAKKHFDIVGDTERPVRDSYREIAKQIRNASDSVVPQYAATRDRAAELFGYENAMKLGYDMMSMSNKRFAALSPKEASLLQNMTPHERNNMRIGMVGAMTDRMISSRGAPDVQALFRDLQSPEMGRRLLSAFGPKEVMDIYGTAARNALIAKAAPISGGGTPRDMLEAVGRKIGSPAVGAVGGAVSATLANIVLQQSLMNFDWKHAAAVVGGAIYGRAVSAAQQRATEQMLRMLNDPSQTVELGKLLARSPQSAALYSRINDLMSEQLASSVAIRSQAAVDEPRPLTIPANRPQRASGGRISPEAMADRIIGQIERARKDLQAQTGTLLNHDDETIVKALKVANERI